MNTATRIRYFLLFIFINLFSLSQSTYYSHVEGKRIFFTSLTSEFQLNMKINGTVDFTTCFCANNIPKLNSCTFQQSNNIVTFNIQYESSSVKDTPFCTLNDDKNREISKVAILEELFFVPSEGFIDGTTYLNISSTPTLNKQQIQELIPTPKISLKYAPSVSLVKYTDNFLFNSTSKTIAKSISTTGYDVELELIDDSNINSPIYYPIFKPFTLFDSSNVTEIIPSLVTVGYKTKFQVSGFNFVVASNTVDIRLFTPGGKIENVRGNVISDKLIEFEYSFPIETPNGLTTFDYSFDDKNTFTKSTFNITLFSYPSDLKVTYTNATFPEEVGCSTFGFNKLSLNLYSQVPDEHKKDIFMTIYDD
eukprot:gene13059-8189_t